MTLAGSIFLIAVGAILRFATHFHVKGLDLKTRRRPGHRDLAVGRLVSSLEANRVPVAACRAVDPEYRDPRPR